MLFVSSSRPVLYYYQILSDGLQRFFLPPGRLYIFNRSVNGTIVLDRSYAISWKQERHELHLPFLFPSILLIRTVYARILRGSLSSIYKSVIKLKLVLSDMDSSQQVKKKEYLQSSLTFTKVIGRVEVSERFRSSILGGTRGGNGELVCSLLLSNKDVFWFSLLPETWRFEVSFGRPPKLAMLVLTVPCDGKGMDLEKFFMWCVVTHNSFLPKNRVTPKLHYTG